MAALVEALSTAQEELADPMERIARAPAVAEGLVLDASAHQVDHPVGGPDDMEGVGDLDGVLEVAGDGAPIALGEVRGHHLDGLELPRLLGAEHRRTSAALLPSTMSITLGSSRSTMPVA